MGGVLPYISTGMSLILGLTVSVLLYITGIGLGAISNFALWLPQPFGPVTASCVGTVCAAGLASSAQGIGLAIVLLGALIGLTVKLLDAPQQIYRARVSSYRHPHQYFIYSKAGSKREAAAQFRGRLATGETLQAVRLAGRRRRSR